MGTKNALAIPRDKTRQRAYRSQRTSKDSRIEYLGGSDE